jgi:chromosome condensin MukBEF MukE localization factor
MSGPCFNLSHALRIGLDTRFNGDMLDNSSRLLVDGESCAIASLVRSGPPPRRGH